ncbi:MAG: Gfo/Idh/MocA family oxidoreductase [Pseudomonadota bacterium]
MTLRAGVIGCGFFAHNHLAAWEMLDGVTVAAVCDLDPAKAQWPGAVSYADAATMLANERLDFVDVITTVDSHRALVELAASHGVAVICQKPFALDLADAEAMVAACAAAAVPLMVHENFRWQAPLVAVRDVIANGEIGEPTYGRIQFRHGYDIYSGQPYLRTEPRLAIMDVGVHLLDVARFYLGRVTRLHCRTQRINPEVAGEDAATITLDHESGAVSLVDVSFFTKRHPDPFPETIVRIEGTAGTVELRGGYEMRVSGNRPAHQTRVEPEVPPFGAKPWHVVQDSVLNIQRHWIDCLRTGGAPATSGADNLETLDLVFKAYRSAETGRAL